MTSFNDESEGWTCSKTRMVPSLFVIHRKYKKGDGTMQVLMLFLLVHVADVEMAGASQQMVDDVMAV